MHTCVCGNKNKRGAKDVNKNLGKKGFLADSVQKLPRNQLVEGGKRVENNARNNHNVQLAELPRMRDVEQGSHCQQPPQDAQNH